MYAMLPTDATCACARANTLDGAATGELDCVEEATGSSSAKSMLRLPACSCCSCCSWFCSSWQVQALCSRNS